MPRKHSATPARDYKRLMRYMYVSPCFEFVLPLHMLCVFKINATKNVPSPCLIISESIERFFG
jgi:hypothetical protein